MYVDDAVLSRPARPSGAKVLIKPVPEDPKKKPFTGSRRLVMPWLIIAVIPLLAGLPYYLIPFEDRTLSGLHGVWSPGGWMGQALGGIGSLMIILGVATYSLRKHVRAFEAIGDLKYWLRIHIFLCTLGPFLVLVHTSFRFSGILSLAGSSMLLVVLSGIFGRWVYGHIPKTNDGEFLSPRAIEHQKADFVHQLTAKYNLKVSDIESMLWRARGPSPTSILHSLALTLRYDLAKLSQRRYVRRFLKEEHVPPRLQAVATRLLEDQLAIQHQVTLSEELQRLFGYWRSLHIPLAAFIFVIMALHIGAAITLG